MTRALHLLYALALAVLIGTAAPAHAQTSTTTSEAPHIAGEPLPDPDQQGGGDWWKVIVPVLVVVAGTIVVAVYRGRAPATESPSTDPST